MQDLVDHISAATGLEPETARKAIGIVLDFVQKNVPADDQRRRDRRRRRAPAWRRPRLPRTRRKAAAPRSPGLMGLADRLMAEGIGMGSMQSFGRALFEGLRRTVGDGPVEAVAAAIPELVR